MNHQFLRTSQVLTAALMAGIVIFAIIAATIGPVAEPVPGIPPPPILTPPAEQPAAPGPATYSPGVTGSATGTTSAAGGNAPTPQNIMMSVWAFLFVGTLAGHLLIGKGINSAAAKAWQQRTNQPSGTAAVLGVYQTFVITRMALIEGVALSGTVILLLYGNVLMLLAPFACVLAMGVLFPKPQQMARFLQAAIDELVKGGPAVGNPPESL